MASKIKVGAMRSPRSKYGFWTWKLSHYTKTDEGYYVEIPRDEIDNDYFKNTRMTLRQNDKLMLVEQVEGRLNNGDPYDAWIAVHPKHGRCLLLDDDVRYRMSPSKSDNQIEIANLKSKLSGAKRSMNAVKKKYDQKKQRVERLEAKLRELQG